MNSFELINPEKVEAFLFDLDGTLIDSAPDLIGALNTLLLENNRDTVKEEDIRPHISYGSKKFVNMAFSDKTCDEKDSLRKRYLELYKMQICNKTNFFNEITDILLKIKEKGIKVGIVTNKPTDCTMLVARSLLLDDIADAIVCGDTLPVSKPDPSPIYLACKMLSVDPRKCYFVGDSDIDVSAGIRANMKTIACGYGYNGSEDPNSWGANYTVKTPEELKMLIYKVSSFNID